MKHKRTILFSLALLLLVGLALAVYFGLSSDRVVAQRVQHTLDRREKVLDKAAATVSSFLNTEDLSFENFANLFDNDDALVYVFCDDSLVLWTSNIIDTKILKKRVPMDADTVCNLYSGHFLVRSMSVTDYSVYLLSMLSTTYSIENAYLVNEFKASFFPNSIQVTFNPEDGAYPLYNASGRIASRFDISVKRTFPFDNVYVVYAVVIVLIVLLMVFFYKIFSKKQVFADNRFSYGGFSVASVVFFFTAVLLTYIYDRGVIRDEEALMKQVAHDLHEERDLEFESSFNLFAQNVATDSMLLKMAFSDNNMINDVVSGYVSNLLFDSVMLDYEVAMTVCKPDEQILVGGNVPVPCSDYFNEIMDLDVSSKIADNLYFIDYVTLDPNYLGVLPLSLSDTTPGRILYMEFYKPVAPNGFGLPRILQTSGNLIPADFSVASYRNNILNYKYGSYIYPNHLSDFHYFANGFSYGAKMKHYTLVDDNKSLVISCSRRDWVALSAPFALFFIAQALLYLPFYIIIRRRTKSVATTSLRRRFQVVVMFTMLIAFGIVGPVSVVYMLRLYNQKTREFNFEQTRSVLLDLRREMDYGQLALDGDRSDLNKLLEQASNTFFVDMNLYDTDGQLVATSRPELFDLKLQSPLMNAQAYANMNNDKSLYYSHIEYVGNNKFQSNYVALPNNNGETVAYLNIPFFSTDEDIRTEVINFAMAYINIILLLVGVSAVVVMVVMRRMTEPLALIQKKMGEVKIDRTNEPIEWGRNDEIGQLVEQYNKLVAELEKSASIIARSERETVWREMARQVAHEIKNPLTPMRLSIQFLQRAWDEQVPDMEQRFKQTTSTLIEQIDTLSEIASAFSNYAKLPESSPEPLDLKQLVTKCINLYNTEENIQISFVCNEETCPFTADPNNLSRAFGNIIKNAIQAIGKNKPDGRIEVKLNSMMQKYVITIADNGKGIKEEDKAKIFLPNFTTKSSGMGIGLSIVHNIIQAADGRISFESTENVGTTFTIELFKNTEKK